MAEIQVAKVEQPKANKRELYATVCFYYGYQLDYVQKLPARDLYLLQKIASKIEANRFLNLTNIAAAPQSKNGRGVQKLIQYYKKVVER
jgi:hypothetical protein